MTYNKKLQLAFSSIKKAFKLNKKPALCCSFGKDSMLTLFLIRTIFKNIPLLYIDSYAEHPSIPRFISLVVKKYKLKLINSFALHSPMWVFKRHGWPDKNTNKRQLSLHYCTLYVKKRPIFYATKKHAFGLLFDGIHRESIWRNYWINKNGLLHWAKEPKIYRCHPIGYFNTAEVYKAIEQFNVPIPPLYSKHLKGYQPRTGCWCCPNGFNNNKYLWYKKYYPSVIEKLHKINFPFEKYLPNYKD